MLLYIYIDYFFSHSKCFTKLWYIIIFVFIVNCEWTSWEIGKCSKGCGDGMQTYTRTKKTQQNYGGICIGKPTEAWPCKLSECAGKC